MLPDQAVAHISTETIEKLADLTRKSASTPEVIAEQVLGYELIITDEGLFSDPDILGGISFEENKIFINASAEAHEGRYNFTVAHEIGHHVLHKDLYMAVYAGRNGIMCREQTKKPLVERQADRFAAALLMPSSEISRLAASRSKPKKLSTALQLARQVQNDLCLEHVSLSAILNRLIDLKLVSESIPYQSSNSRFRYRKTNYPVWARWLYRIAKRFR